MSKRDNKPLSEAEIEALDGQEAQVKETSEGAGPPVVGQDAEGAEVDLYETRSVVEEDEPAEADDDGSEDLLIGEEDGSEPSQWESDILCVADPFVRAKNLAGTIRPPVLARFREDCQRVIMRLRLGGNLNALLWFDPRTRPPSPPPQPNQRRRQRPQGGERGNIRGGGRGVPVRGHTRGGAPKGPEEAQTA